MLRIAILAAVAAVATVVAADAALADNLGLRSGPMIRMDERRWDFGTMRQYEQKDHAFRFRNEGTEALRIHKIETDCGCTAGVPGDSILAPGAESVIDVTFQSRSAEGKLQKVVVVFTNDPAEPRIDLVVSAEVQPYILMTERSLEFGEVRLGATPELATVLTSDPPVEYKILQVEGADRHVDFSYEPAGTGSWRLTARLKPDAPLGKFQAAAHLILNHPQVTRERVFVRGTVYSFFVLEDSRLNFATIRTGKERTLHLKITGNGSEGYEITSAEATSPHLKPVLRRTGNGYDLEVTLTAPQEKARLVEEIVLRTTDPQAPEIRIEARAAVL